MIILYGSVIIFNLLAYKLVKRLSGNMILHIWVFTCTFQTLFDVFIDLKYHGYWYVSKDIDWSALPAYCILIPPVNLLFLNYFPFRQSLSKRIAYFAVAEVLFLSYELLCLLPAPWGFFRYGWWSIWHSAAINPILLLTLIGYYKWVKKLERNLIQSA